jgi:phosphopantothenoylcysteine decarboxylase/phosphopantothenate--cysteine ligase
MHVVVGVTGGIAAYKATSLIRAFTEAGHTVKVIPTANALRFIGATTLEALSHNTVDPDLYTDVAEVKHVQLGQEADLIVVAPATASFLARYAAGIADDLLGNTLLATTAPVLVAPAMHSEMWNHQATQANVKTLRERGVDVLEPAVGRLTGEDSGPGRLPEPEEIFAAAIALRYPQDLAGKRVLVTAGGTQEPVDPVRFLGNRSSGKQGVSIALAAKARGAEVTLIAANLSESSLGLRNVIRVSTADQMLDAVNSAFDSSDIIIMAAAVADFKAASYEESKIKKSNPVSNYSIDLVPNVDILKSVVERRNSENKQQLIVGFAAETASNDAELTKLAEIKLENKGCDFLVANNVAGGAIFNSDQTSVLILNNRGEGVGAQGSKKLVAHELLDFIVR